MAKMQAMKTEVEQTKKELAEEKGRISSLIKEIGELKFTADAHVERHY